MTGRELASLVNISYSTIKRVTKQAIDSGKSTLSIDGVTYVIRVIHDSRGKAYDYITIDKKKIGAKYISVETINELIGFDVAKKKHSIEDKLMIITFCRKYNYRLSVIIDGLFAINRVYASDKEKKALERKVYRWQKAFASGGASSLEDKRGKHSSNSKIDTRLFREAIAGAGSQGIRQNIYGMHELYCYLIDIELGRVLKHPDNDYITYQGFLKAFRVEAKSNPQLKSYLKSGWDGLLQDYIVGNKDIAYPNQEWQVDATKFDFMCKIPTDDGYKVGRVEMTAVIDVYSGSAVASLVEQINSNTHAQLLYKAFELMGKPELIYRDNGMDYTSHHINNLLEDVGITTYNADVGQGRQKGKIERFFGVLQGEIHWIPGYIGNDVKKRKEIEDQEASKISRRTGQATRIEDKDLLTFEELTNVVDNLMAQKYSDYQDFNDFKLPLNELETIYKKLGKKSTRTLQTSGISYEGIRYQSVDIWATGINRGEKVTIYENMENINEIFIYKNNKLIGTGLNSDLGAEAMSLEEHRKAKKEYIKHNVNPTKELIREGKRKYKEMQDEFTREALGYEPAYKKDSHISHNTTPKDKDISKAFPVSPSKTNSKSSDYGDMEDLMYG